MKGEPGCYDACEIRAARLLCPPLGP
jgi:hypothetical protein